jgi:hypothetical protein
MRVDPSLHTAAAAGTHSGAYELGQVMGLVILGVLLFWLFRNARRRVEKRHAAQAPPPSAEALIAEVRAAAAANGSEAETANGSEAETTNGSEPGTSDLEGELREIYERVGHPEAFDEAKRKVTDLAGELAEDEGMAMNEALRVAYERSLAEHREYLAARGPT